MLNQYRCQSTKREFRNLGIKGPKQRGSFSGVVSLACQCGCMAHDKILYVVSSGSGLEFSF